MNFWKRLWYRVFGEPTVTDSRTDTEYTAEVVRITQILPHDNADRLEIARFEMKDTGETGYQVVVQKGQFYVGQLAVYFSVDCLLPTSHPDFVFLLNRLDGHNKSVFRLRAARLRKVFSQGLLIYNRYGQDFGQSAAAVYGVTYMRDPEPPGQPTRATAKPKPQPLPVYTVDSLKKVPNLFDGLEPHQLYVTEKIHGTNMRFGWVRTRILGVPIGWRFVVGSHRVIKTGDHQASWYKEDVWIEFAKRNRLAERTKALKGYKFFGELYGHTYSGQRIQDMTYDLHPEAGPSMCIFDIQVGGLWLEPPARVLVCAELGFKHVPVVHSAEDTAPNITIPIMASGLSLIASHLREGVVVETVGVVPRRKAKYVSEAYLLRNES